MKEPPHRRRTITKEIGPFPWENPDGTVGHLGPFSMSIGISKTGVCEVFFTDRGKSGTQIEDFLYNLGVSMSKAIQEVVS